MSSFMRRVVDAVWPSGSAWVSKRDEGLDQLLDGLSDGLQADKDQLEGLDRIRDPAETALLGELEIEYGIVPDPLMSDADRRASLAVKKNESNGIGSDEDLEAVLQAAGFDVFVYSNDPAINPAPFVSSVLMSAGSENAFAGEPDAVAEVSVFDLLVNGDIVVTVPIYLMSAGSELAFAGEVDAVAEIDGVTEGIFEYVVPVDSADWPYVFFVGGAATFLPDGSIETIATATIPAARRVEFERIILEVKPITTWAILIIQEI